MTTTAPGTDLEVASAGFDLVEAQFDEDRQKQIAAYFGVNAELPALIPFLSFCALNKLNPIGGLVWLLKGKDGTHRIYAGRDCYLTIANRQQDFLGVQSDVHREHDQFNVRWTTTADGMVPEITHVYGHGPITSEGGGERVGRGGVMGAWAIAFRKGHNPVYFYAPAYEYMGDPEKSAWTFLSAMTIKAAESNCLRRMYGIAGATPSDEFGTKWVDAAPATDDDEPPPAQDSRSIEEALGDMEPAELRAEVLAALTEAEERYPGTWSAAKVAMVFGGQGPERVRGILSQIESEMAAMPPRADVSEDEIPDAEVVEPSEVERLQHEIADLEALLDEADSEELREQYKAAIGEHEERLRELEGQAETESADDTGA